MFSSENIRIFVKNVGGTEEEEEEKRAIMALKGFALFSILLLSLFASSVRSEETETKEFVLTLDHSNFTETINKHDFIVVEFYAPW